MALIPQLFGKLDDQNRVFRRQANDGDQPYLEIHIVRHADSGHCQHRTERAHRHNQHDHQRDRPAFVQRDQQQKDHQQGQGKQPGRLAAGYFFLVGEAGPFVTDAGWQLGDDSFNLRHRFAGTDTRWCVTRDPERGVAVVAGDLHRAFFPVRRNECTQWHQRAAAVRHVQLEHAFRGHPRTLLGLHHNPLLTSGVGEITDHRGAESGGQRVADRLEADPQRPCFFAVDVQA